MEGQEYKVPQPGILQDNVVDAQLQVPTALPLKNFPIA
jgi:hypothetical protein